MAEFIDLFCGIGGASYGFRKAGLKPVLGIELDPIACNVYKIFVKPEIGVLNTDIRKIESSDLPDVPVIIGCPPCQGFSTINGRGRKNKLQDSRNRLILEYARIVAQKLPEIFVFENVPPVKKSSEFSEMLNILGDFYNIYYDICDLGLYGGGDWIPIRPLTHRNRLLCIGVRKDLNVDPCTLFPETFDSPLPLLEMINNEQINTIDNRRRNLSKRLKRLAEYIPQGGTRNDVPEVIKQELFYPCWLKSSGFRDVFSRVSVREPLPYVTGGILTPDKGPYLHPLENRGFTVDEAKFIMSFPLELPLDNLPLSKVETYIGNAVPPQSFFPIGKKILQLLEINEKQTENIQSKTLQESNI